MSSSGSGGDDKIPRDGGVEEVDGDEDADDGAFINPEDIVDVIDVGDGGADEADEEEGGEGGDEGGEGDEEDEDETPNEFEACFVGHTDEMLVVSGGGDDRAYLWRYGSYAADASPAERVVPEGLFELSGHKDTVIDVAFNAAGNILATASMDSTIRLWNPEDGSFLRALEDASDDIEWMDWHTKGDVLCAGDSGGAVWMWNAATGAVMQVFAGHGDAVLCGKFSADGKNILTGSADCSVRVWDPKTGSCVHAYEGVHEEAVLCLATSSAHSSVVLVGSADQTASLLNFSTGKSLGKLKGHLAEVEAAGICEVQPLLATGSVDGTLRIWDANTLRQRCLCAHEDAVTRLAMHPQEPLVFTSCIDRRVRMWDARSGNCERTWLGHHDSVMDIKLSKDGRYLLTASDDQTAMVWRV